VSVNIVPFPLSRRIAFVERHADIISSLPAEGAERHLAYQLKVQHDVLKRRGVDPECIKREIASLERAILALSEQESVAWAASLGVVELQALSARTKSASRLLPKEVLNLVISRWPQILEKRKSPSGKPPIVKWST
jgi:Family of unknown function (DUF6074)